MANGNQRDPAFVTMMKGLKEMILEELETKFPGTKKISEEIESEVSILFNQYREGATTEIHALRLVNLIMVDLESLQLIPIQRAAGNLLEAEEILFRHLISEESVREAWNNREALRAELIAQHQAEEVQ